MDTIIRVENLIFDHVSPSGDRFTAIRGVNLEIRKGELVALIGPNGSGKTTLARHFNSLHIPTQGKVWVDGLDTSLPVNFAAIRRTVGMVFQNPEDQIISSSVEEEVAFGMENLGIPREEMRRRIQRVLKEYNLWHARYRAPQLLSSGQIQRLAMAGVLVMKPQCLIFDETTAMLDPVGRETVMRSIHEMHEQGLTVLFITHAMEEAVQAERILVMHDGKLVMDAAPAEVFSHPGKIHKLGLELPRATSLASRLKSILKPSNPVFLEPDDIIQAIPRYDPTLYQVIPETRAKKGNLGSQDDLIVVEHLKHTYLQGTPLEQRSLKGVDLVVNTGVVYALLGSTGSGKSTILQHINGLYRPQSGSVQVGRYDLNDEHIDMQQLRKLVGLVFQNPDMQLFERYVGDEIAFGPRVSGLRGTELREKVRQAMELVGLDFETYRDRITSTLSGGERKKVTIASALVMDPRILLLDEPLAGLDPTSRKSLLKALVSMVRGGLTLVLSSHNIDEVAEITTHVSLVQDGRIAASGTSASILSNSDTMKAAGLLSPLATRIADGFRSQGWPLHGMIYEEEGLVKSVQSLGRETQ